MLSASFDVAGLSAHFDRLNEAIGTGVRVAAQAGAQVFYDEVKLRAAKNRKSGRLADSIYQKFVPELSTEGLSARYHISWRKSYMGEEKVGGLVSAPHGQLIEYGWYQRYVMGKVDGKYTGPMVRPEKVGTPKPKRRASQAEKDAYWIPLPTPIKHAPKSFLRSSYEAKKAEAVQAAVDAMQEHVARAFL